MCWLGMAIKGDFVREYWANKALDPANIPTTAEELAIEEALARAILRYVCEQASASFPSNLPAPAPGLLPPFEPILVSGSVFTNAPSLGHALLTIIDGLQPCGITTITLDKNHLAAALGAAATNNPLLSVQVMESNAFTNLATLISPVNNARTGMSVLRLKVTNESTGQETQHEIKHGNIEIIPLLYGQVARLQLTPLHRSDVGLGGHGRGGTVRATGSALGIVVDARGRPLRLPEDTVRRQDLIKKWLWVVGG
jgi:hypothetical protein